MPKTQSHSLGWMATGFGLERHHWRIRANSRMAVSRCGRIINPGWLVYHSWKPKCARCLILLDEVADIKEHSEVS